MRAEILAPVGNKEMLEAAVRSGADAVYLGAEEFSARRNAENFSKEELKEAIEYCKIRGVKVYLTLNILIKDSEMESAFNLAKYAYCCGIDGIIVEDIGLAQILHKQIPQLKLHASTQMSVHSPLALEELKRLGFCQVVAAREMSRQELEQFCKRAKELNIIVEVFVHGALCMCLSGQCLLSAFLGSRSGNRGLCAGPCRLPFSTENGTGYDLSLKDLSLLEYLIELENMGVGSFKIEGRMKRPEYVAAAVTACKEVLDKGYASSQMKEVLRNVFSRSGFTDGYYQNRLGIEMFGTRTKDDVLSGEKAFPVLHGLYRNERQSVPINIEFYGNKNKEILLKIIKDNNVFTVRGQVPETAKNKEVTKEDIKASLIKLGGTPYYAQNVLVELDRGLFIPQSTLNSLRRQGIEQVDRFEKESAKRECNVKFNSNNKFVQIKKSNVIIARFEEYNQIPGNIEKTGIKAIVYPLEKEPEELEKISLPKIADIPPGFINENVILERLLLFKNNGFNSAFCNNLAQISICKKVGMEVLAGSGLNIYNSYSLKTAECLGVKSAIISNEVSKDELKEMNSQIPRGYIIYGNIPLMVFKNCPIKNGKPCKDCDKKGVLTDRMGVEFPVRCRMGYSELLNSCPIWLGDKWNINSNLDYGVLYFTTEQLQRVNEVIESFTDKRKPDCKYTNGMFFRGVI